MQPSLRGLNILQKISMSLMGVLVMITFIGANLHALFWQSSDWLVSTVLPAVVVQLTNEERADNAAAPLRRSSTLDAAAKLKAEHMAKNEYFAHFSPDGISPWYWFKETGYVYAHAGENLAIHFTDSTEVVDAWMKSPTHRQNIVNGLYTEIGVGTAKGEFEGYDTVYVVQLFGTPAVAPAPAPIPVVPEPEPVLAVADEPATLGSAVESETVAATQIEESVVIEDTLIIEPVPEETPVTPEVATETEELVLNNTPEPIAPVAPAEEKEVEEVIVVPEEVVVIESPIISTSSGLAIANITTPNDAPTKSTLASIATQPNELLQMVYLVLGSIVFILLAISIIMEARRLRFVQVAYGILLLFGMTGLWYAHSLLTAGAVIV